MNREQRHTVHYLAARARKGDEWSHALLQRLSTLARSGQTSGTATASVPSAEGLGEGTAATTHPRTSSASTPNPSHLAARASHQRGAAGVGAVPATASAPPSQTIQRSGDMPDPDIGKCDECGSEDGTRQLAPYHSTLAWLCGECRTRLALIESFRPDPHDRANDEAMSERYA